VSRKTRPLKCPARASTHTPSLPRSNASERVGGRVRRDRLGRHTVATLRALASSEKQSPGSAPIFWGQIARQAPGRHCRSHENAQASQGSRIRFVAQRGSSPPPLQHVEPRGLGVLRHRSRVSRSGSGTPGASGVSGLWHLPRRGRVAGPGSSGHGSAFEPDEFLESGDEVIATVRVRTLGSRTPTPSRSSCKS
jgi:hypothetical protein